MSALRALQQQVAQSILAQHQSSDSFISSDCPDERLAIYRNTILENCRNTLALTYPGVWVLLGQDCADQVAKFYASQWDNLPQTGCLDDWGEGFINYLANQPQLKQLPYLQDFARLEWLLHCADMARTANCLMPSDFSALTESELMNISIEFVPSFYLYHAQFDMQQIQAVIENQGDEQIVLVQKPVYAVIVKQQQSVATLWVKAALWHFLYTLQQGICLEKAIEQAVSEHETFDAVLALHFLMAQYIVSAFKQ